MAPTRQCSIEGYVAEGPGFNISVVPSKTLLTPGDNLLEGITRRTVFEPAKEMGVEARTANLKPQELIEAQEAFLSTPAGGIVPVTRVSARPTRVPWQPARRGSQYQLRIFAVIRPTASLPSVTDPLIRSAPV